MTKTRKAPRSFLNPPFPSDEGTLTLLDELESHERRRIIFQGSPAGTLLGGMFHGMDTKWQTVEPTLAWIRELKAATQISTLKTLLEPMKTENKGHASVAICMALEV